MGLTATQTFLLTTAIAAGGTAAQISTSRSAAKQRKKADAVARAQAESENQRSIRQSINKSRRQQAALIAQGASQTGGFGASSGVSGAVGSAQTQSAANVGFANQTAASNSLVNSRLQQANSLTNKANTFGAIASLPGQFGFDLKSTSKEFFAERKANRGII